MSKLSTEEKFFDISDYGRPIAVACAKRLLLTKATPVQVTLMFGVCGLVAVLCILNGYFLMAGIFLILKSIIDAIDGELARMKNTPSYTGRYLDSIFDIVLNLMFLLAICFVSDSTIWTALMAFACIQLQGTLYNYYYVILRHNSPSGDKTSKIFESGIPKAFPKENQKTVNILYRTYTFLYIIYDRTIYLMDRKADETSPFPKWFMTLISFYGLGFQLLIISIMLALGWVEFIIPFFISYTIFIFVFIGIRRGLLNERPNISNTVK